LLWQRASPIPWCVIAQKWLYELYKQSQGPSSSWVRAPSAVNHTAAKVRHVTFSLALDQ
jgi:hypothetical protein